jgi:DNA helicase HerA-like ATPase
MLVNPSSLVQLPVLRQALKYAKVKKFSNENKASFFARFALDLFYSQSFDAAAKRQKISQYMNEIFKIKDSLISNDGNEESFELKEKIGILETTFKQYTPNYGNFISNDTEKKFVNTLEEIVGDFNLSKCLSETEFEIELIDELLSGLDYAFSHEECKGNKNIRSHCMTMLTRIEGIRDDYANNIFSNDEVKLERYMKLFEFNEAIEVIDVANVETVDLRFFSSFILSKCLRDAKQRRTNDEKQKNYNFIFDEAHIYIKEANESEGNVKNVFESIAKEGRKFGIFLQLISQRPSEVSRTVVSQCANFILHRIGNSFDLDMIKKGNPYINEDLIKRISILPSGCALFLGESFPIPIEIRIDSQDYDTSAPKINN